MTSSQNKNNILKTHHFVDDKTFQRYKNIDEKVKFK